MTFHREKKIRVRKFVVVERYQVINMEAGGEGGVLDHECYCHKIMKGTQAWNFLNFFAETETFIFDF